AVERFAAASKAPPGSQERLMLDAMVSARYALLQVQRPVGSVGLAVADLFREEEAILCDVSFAATVPRGAILATRVLYPESEDFCLTSGAALPVSPDDVMDIAEIMLGLGARSPADFARLGREDRDWLTTRILRTLVRSGVTDFMVYAEPGAREREDPPFLRLLPPETELNLDAEQAAFSGNRRSLRGPSRLELPHRVCRNAPCPCGSGRKFKKCCGP
ncbi:MAG: SEC-C domain-containing protein, partial [Planctomycetota bacterium]